MAKRTKPRAASLAYLPKKRAKKETPRIHNWPESEESKPLGFAGYKAGMTHVLATDNRSNSLTSGSEVFVPVTIVETPPMRVAAIRAYTRGYNGLFTFTDIWAYNDDLKKRLTPKKKDDPKKKLDDLKKGLKDIVDLRAIMQTQPKLVATPKKAPDLMEVALGGGTEEKLKFLENNLGKEVNISDVFEEKAFVDTTSVTKGKGFQGVVKRYGVKRQPRKSTGRRRHMGTGGSWHPARKLWTEKLPGQLGYYTRTEYNKFILRIGKTGEEVTPKGGFLRYGPVKNSYVMVYGSIPGPTKRLIRFTAPRRAPSKSAEFDIAEISTMSKQGA